MVSNRPPMRFGIRLPVSGPFVSRENVERIARRAEDLGFDALIAHDHVSWDGDDKYHFSIGSAESVDEVEARGGSVTDFYESMTALTYAAGLTDEIHVIPTAAVLPWRHPVLLAKQAATLGALSDGRFELGVCVGNVEKDFEALDVRFEERGAIMDEYLEVLARVLREGGIDSHEGEYLDIAGGTFRPAAPDLPIWYGGESEPALRRTARYADGWLPLGAPDTMRERIPRLGEHLEQEDRSLDDVEVGVLSKLCIADTEEAADEKAGRTLDERLGLEEVERHPELAESYVIGSPDGITETLEEYLDAGVEHFFCSLLTHSPDQVIRDMEVFGDEVMSRF